MSSMLEQLQKAHDIDSRYMHARQQFLFSSVALRDFADAEGVLSPQKISFFQAKENTSGQGFKGALHRGLTNFSGAPSTMPQDQLFVAKAFGIRILNRRADKTPRTLIHDLTHGTCSIEVRRGDSTAYNLGPLEFWPCGRFGNTSKSVAAIGAPPGGGNVTLIDYPQNGDAGLRVFEDGSELVFKQGSLIEVSLGIHDQLILTDDGEKANNPNDIRECVIQAIFDGFTLSAVSA